MTELTANALREAMSYDPATGNFTWITRRQGTWVGRPAGRPGKNGGYGTIMLRGKLYLAHRLAWLYVHGEWPPHLIDHINGNRGDNRICNLRPATSSQNAINKKLRSDNVSGSRGVYWKRNERKWIAQIGVQGKRIHLGSFEDQQKAEHAYRNAAALHHGDFRHHERRDTGAP